LIMLRATANRHGSFVCRFVVALLLALIAGTVSARHPIALLDTSSPRATFASFLALTVEAARRQSEYRDSPNPATQDALWRIGDEAADLLDLSQVAPAARRETGVEAFFLLWEVIARVELPDPSEIPDAPADKDGDEKAAQPMRWRLPGSRITIDRVEEGPRAGEFLFSPFTVERARHFFVAARELP
jgi:MscS family membrane protein